MAVCGCERFHLRSFDHTDLRAGQLTPFLDGGRTDWTQIIPQRILDGTTGSACFAVSRIPCVIWAALRGTRRERCHVWRPAIRAFGSGFVKRLFVARLRCPGTPERQSAAECPKILFASLSRRLEHRTKSFEGRWMIDRQMLFFRHFLIVPSQPGRRLLSEYLRKALRNLWSAI